MSDLTFQQEQEINALVADKIMHWKFLDISYMQGWYRESIVKDDATTEDLQCTSFYPVSNMHDAFKVVAALTVNAPIRLHLVCNGVDDDDVDKGFAQAAFAEIMPLDDAWVECTGWHAIERSICLAALRYKGIAVPVV